MLAVSRVWDNLVFDTGAPLKEYQGRPLQEIKCQRMLLSLVCELWRSIWRCEMFRKIISKKLLAIISNNIYMAEA